MIRKTGEYDEDGNEIIINEGACCGVFGAKKGSENKEIAKVKKIT